MRKFPNKFAKYVCDGDEITMHIGDFVAIAKVYRDCDTTQPDERDDGFWPSLCSGKAGYIGPNATHDDYLKAKQDASEIMDAWKKGEWWYVGIAVRIWHDDMPLTGEFSNAIWGIDCNYPGSDNSYLWETANELVEEALAEARALLEKLCTLTV